ncbi:MAG: TIGR00269 family protein [Candidatus Aenigmarchaeota archaeon]|nr:TIGR00269 family protein [Candidatus Aenigmarchaeota archaeon]
MSQKKPLCKCGKPAVIFRKYEGSYLCKVHFLQSVERKVKKNIRIHNLVKPGDKIGIGVSGGKDSMVTLYLMHKILSPRRDIEIVSISLDEGIRGYRESSLKYAKELCRKLGIRHYVYSFRKEFGKTLDQKVRQVKKSGKECGIEVSCTLCGVARRYLLNKKSRELKLTKLCTGHNLDDESQAVLMNYIRGDLYRASRMGPEPIVRNGKFIGRIKPLRIIPEKEVALYAILSGLKYHNKECPYRCGLRLEVRDFVNKLEEKHSGIKFSILETFDRILPSLRSQMEKEIGELYYCKKCGEPSSKEICKTCELWR